MVFEFGTGGESSKKGGGGGDQVLLCELVGKSKSKKEVNLSDACVPVCEFVCRCDLATQRKTYGAVAFRLGKIDATVDDILAAAEAVVVNQRVDFETRSYHWVKVRPAKGNEP